MTKKELEQFREECLKAREKRTYYIYENIFIDIIVVDDKCIEHECIYDCLFIVDAVSKHMALSYFFEENPDYLGKGHEITFSCRD